ncbi:MAG: efflux RND transporter permease subunit [Woeseiaceae bacterium]|nr:efflux RND transporter permease subunit [Woeseiaceae bacterium]
MKITEFCLENRTTTLFLTAVAIIGGMVAYQNMGRLEDPEFTIKDALIITPYPGASAEEVEQEVSDEIEIAAQQLGQLKEVESRSERGLSTVTVTMQDRYDKTTLPQVWDELRRKINDARANLPPGAGPSLVVDDFGDVYGVFFAIYGSEYTYDELWDVAKFLRRELLLVDDVAKIDVFGDRPEVVYVELDRERLSQSGLSPAIIISELQNRNLVSNSGRVNVGDEFITIDPTGLVDSVEDIGAITLTGEAGGAQIRLRDIATIRRGFVEPADRLLRYDGNLAVGLAISTASGGNVVTMGEALEARMRELAGEIPLGVEFGIVSLQSESVTVAINSFLMSLLQAVGIVIIVLLAFMGAQSGFLIGFILFLTIAGSFVFMSSAGVTLERISLGALIIALGMLVDNAIVVVDGMLVRLQKGMERTAAALEVVKQTAWPLLGATIIAVLAFAAIGTSQDSTGEYTRSLYTVILISLLLSWVTAVTVTPLLGVMFLKVKETEDGTDPYGSGFYRAFRGFLQACIRLRWVTMAVVIVVFVASVIGFGRLEQSFFPNSTRPQFMVDYWLPQGTSIERTAADVEAAEDYIRGIDGVAHVSSVIGGGAPRFLLTYSPEKGNSAYAQLLVDVADSREIDRIAADIQQMLEARFSDSNPQVRKFILGPGEPGKIQARFIGEDLDVLRDLASQAEAIMGGHPNTFGVRNDWRERVKVVQPVIAQDAANLNQISRKDIAGALLQGFQGARVGVYREGDELLPIILRAPEYERLDVASIQNLQIWSPAAQRMIPLRQVVLGFETVFEDDLILRLNRQRTITVLADPRVGEAAPLLAELRPAVEAIPLPPGYRLEWWGEYKSSNDAREGLSSKLPLFLLAMVVLTVALFNSLKQMAVIWLVVPLAVIGVTIGLGVTNQPFGFMATLGFLSLSGMLIKNAIVLIDEINLQNAEGKAPIDAVLDSAVSRLRPVAMAAATTILGMAPLFPDAFFVSMAVTIAFGLGFATILTMVVVPVLYSIFYRVKVA